MAFFDLKFEFIKNLAQHIERFVRGINVCSNKKLHPSLRGDHSGMGELRNNLLKINFQANLEQISFG